MADTYGALMEGLARLVDVAGVGAILVGIVAATVFAVRSISRREGDPYTDFRRRLGRGILLGLELLVAADIIRTVAIAPTIESVAVLGGIILVRTFLSFAMEVEVSGRWPWQHASGPPRQERGPGPS